MNPGIANVSLRTKLSPVSKVDFKKFGPYRIFLEQMHGPNVIGKGKEVILMYDQ